MEAAQDLERFVACLRDLSNREVGALLANAARIRASACRVGALPDSFEDFHRDPRRPLYERRLAECVCRSQQAARLTEAAAAMVWLRTLRALGSRELRHSGRQMWRELGRGQPYAEEAFRDRAPASVVASVVAELAAALGRG